MFNAMDAKLTEVNQEASRPELSYSCSTLVPLGRDADASALAHGHCFLL
jgi:hypothetical protein